MDFALYEYKNICKVSVKNLPRIWSIKRSASLVYKTDLAYFIQMYKELF